ncbi:hypothetical protein MTZ49_11305 [Entomomonas sp. E2T0]|uniref:hypothetical protein n=1 Tax=Entomomonas sp. E2T0 TaxID=2930213 RepID=UPI0022280FC3|nr:hypothetical protein [Entomomonas sp. E2T0]UYZ83184.1 hypothetical protein MTZ49_11305 [Entomomonas sp. E2T0]
MEAIHEKNIRLVIGSIWGSSIGNSIKVTTKTMDVLLDVLKSFGEKAPQMGNYFNSIESSESGGLRGAILLYGNEIADTINTKTSGFLGAVNNAAKVAVAAQYREAIERAGNQ